MSQDADVRPVTTGRTLRMGELREPVVRERKSRFTPSVKRSEEDRLRRHRERAIAAWLRDLSR